MQSPELNEKNVEVFTTNIRNREDAQLIVERLRIHFPGWKVNVDLHDCDKILRIEGFNIVSFEVEKLVQKSGYSCKVLT